MDFTVNEHGFCGSFYEGKSFKNKVVIFAGGHNMSHNDTISAGMYLPAAGFSVMFLTICQAAGTPDEMCRVPVEYVSNAVEWLKAHYNNDSLKIGIVGCMEGGTYALLAASLTDEFSLVVACSPYDYVMESVSPKYVRNKASTFTYQGNDIPYSPWFILEEGILRLKIKSLKDSRYGEGRFCRYIYDRNTTIDKSRILVENINADVLLVAPEDDDMWFSKRAVLNMESQLKSAGCRHRVRASVYENASHVLGCSIDYKSRWGRYAKKTLPYIKQHKKEALEAAKESRMEILQFLRDW